jgi:hypothetical protein
MAHFRFSHPSTPRVRIIQVAPPRKGPSTSAGQGRPHSNKPAGQPGRAGSAAPTPPPPHSRSSGHGTHHSVRHTQLHNITTAAPNNTRRGIITMVISPLSVSRGSSLAWPVSRAGSGGISRSHPQQSQEQASRQAEQQQQPQAAAAAEKGTPKHQQVALQAMLPPEGRSLDSERLFSKKGVRTQAGMGAKMTPTPTLAASSHSNLNVTPRPTPRPRHGQPALIEQQAPLADVMGPTRRSLAPTATICPHPPKKSQSIPKTPV